MVSESFGDELEKEISLLLREQRRQGHDSAVSRGSTRGASVLRSGSAPPTVEGSFNAVGGLFGNSNDPFSGFDWNQGSNGGFGEEELRSDPDYLNYYYSNVNMNPRLPPPLMSKEDWRLTQRLKGGNAVLGGIGDGRKVSRVENGIGKPPSFFPPGFKSKKEEREVELESVHWGNDGLPGIGLGARKKSLAEIFQNDLGSSNPPSRHPSRPVSRNAFDENIDALASAEADLNFLRRETSNNVQGSYAAALGSSLSRSTTPDPQHIARVPSPCPTPIGEGRAVKKNVTSSNSFNGMSSGMSDSSDLVAAFSGINLTTNGNHFPSQLEQDAHPFNMHGGGGREHGKQHPYLNKSKSAHHYVGGESDVWSPQMERPRGTPYYKGSAPSSLNGDLLSPHYNHFDGTNSSFANYNIGNYNLSPSLDPRAGNHQDALYLEYLRSAEYMELLQQAYFDSAMSPHKSQFVSPMGNKPGGSNHGHFRNHAFDIGMGYHGSPLSSPNMPGGLRSPIRPKDFNMPGIRNLGGGVGNWNMDISLGSSLLEEFKSNKTKCFELSDIVNHVVEFSADQYGSRFIQQKLETATVDEKNMVFEEINQHALSLMTDVFGNYVIQKFFEHGMNHQRRELACKLEKHVLNLSLQMYGCRVIQKAIEVVDVDQKIKMVYELEGNIMRCVRDQNGNHVIQKCIECVPEEHIQFIVESFFDQVLTLSTHPYGCRVIQRVLEHCKDPMTQSKVMDEILGSVSMLAQDQYGNYVIQHVLEHGKPHERTTIIKELAGKIVIMSQQKFASNVVEKCLAFGDAEERQILVNEMLGTTEENEPLQAMMKDQFANYVVQKVLETCTDKQREHILSRIKAHLNALKKYTYGKHIVARVEKLVAAGERRMSMQTS